MNNELLELIALALGAPLAAGLVTLALVGVVTARVRGYASVGTVVDLVRDLRGLLAAGTLVIAVLVAAIAYRNDFHQSIEGRVLYAREMLTISSRTGASNSTRITIATTTGQERELALAGRFGAACRSRDAQVHKPAWSWRLTCGGAASDEGGAPVNLVLGLCGLFALAIAWGVFSAIPPAPLSHRRDRQGGGDAARRAVSVNDALADVVLPPETVRRLGVDAAMRTTGLAMVILAALPAIVLGLGFATGGAMPQALLVGAGGGAAMLVALGAGIHRGSLVAVMVVLLLLALGAVAVVANAARVATASAAFSAVVMLVVIGLVARWFVRLINALRAPPRS